MDKFVNLHRHDHFSFFDGLDLAIRAADRVKELDQPALGLMNHGNPHGLVDHYRLCQDRDVKPILGIEAYITLGDEKPTDRKELRHQTIWAENAIGYENLCWLVTRSYQDEMFYYKPRMSLKMLEERSEGLLLTTGCPSSMVQKAFSEGDRVLAQALIERMASSFKGRFWIELQHHETAKVAAQWLVLKSYQLGIPLLATNDSHYVRAEDKFIHDIVLKMRTKGKGEDNPTYGEGFHLLSRKEMEAALIAAHPWLKRKELDQALDQTVELAERANFKFEDHKPSRMLPALWPDADSQLVLYANQGMADLGLDGRKDYRERLDYELKVIRHLGYIEYFHVVKEITSWAKSVGILIGPRGSVCGSLLAYVLGVTTVDPLRHNTIFERFLHMEKKSVPDVDLDIDNRRRDEVIQWILQKYSPHATRIASFGRYRGGNVVNDLVKAFPELNEDYIPPLKDAAKNIDRNWRKVELKNEDLEEYPIFDVIDAEVPGFKKIVMKLYNTARYVGQHPGGVCFTPTEPEKWIPVVRMRDGRQMTGYNFLDCEYIGLLKMDFLGLAAMGAIKGTMDLVQERHGISIDLSEIDLKVPKAYDNFARGNTAGIFQFESGGAISILQKIEPENFAQVAASTALNRPGVSVNLERYVAGKKLASQGAEFTGFFSDTFNAAVYQEQFMQVLRSLGFSWREADDFTKSLKNNSKSYAIFLEEQRGVGLFKKLEQALNESYIARGKAPNTEAIARFIERIAQYSFNRAHAIGYAMVAYWMMWLKLSFPLEFWTALLNVENFDLKRIGYEGCAVADGCYLLPPHVNGSAEYTIENNMIRVGLKTLKGVGPKAAEAIVKAGPYESAIDIKKLPRRVVNSRVLKALIEHHALDMKMSRIEEWTIQYNKKRHASRHIAYGRSRKDEEG